MYPLAERRFLAVSRISIVSLFVLIFLGGVVRSTGSGLACPDWPTCFDRVVPPINEADIKIGYQEEFIKERANKTQRVADLLDAIGFEALPALLRRENELKLEPFSLVKSWTQFSSRLAGLLTGVFLLGCVYFSITYLTSRKRIFFLSILNLVLAGLLAWLASILVFTSSYPWVITIHILLLILILTISIYTFFQAKLLRERNLLSNQHPGGIRTVASVASVLTLFQIGLGTRVREQIDVISVRMNELNRSEWVQGIGFEFNLHRDLAWIVFILNFILLVLIRGKYMGSTYHFKYMTYVALLIAAQIVAGYTLANLALPLAAQSIHLLLACLIFGAQYSLVLLLKQNKLYKSRIVR